jgi:hypothetical protein
MKTLKIIAALIGIIAFLPISELQSQYIRKYYSETSYIPEQHRAKNFYRDHRYDYWTIDELELRIYRADRRGELTAREFRILDKKLFELKRYKERVYKSRRVTPNERRNLENRKIELDRLIVRYSTNSRRAW